MSFKRDGDDRSWLAQLRKRRTNELLSENIPDGEAKLLSNGRLACLVCHYKPVFDTINMLHVHRSGKKHISADVKLQQSRMELEELARKRVHEEIVRRGVSSVSLPTVSDTGILPTSCLYNPLSQRTKPTDRKRRLCLETDANTRSDDASNCLRHVTHADIVSGLHSRKQPKQLKNIFATPSGAADLEIKPYVKKNIDFSRLVNSDCNGKDGIERGRNGFRAAEGRVREIDCAGSVDVKRILPAANCFIKQDYSNTSHVFKQDDRAVCHNYKGEKIHKTKQVVGEAKTGGFKTDTAPFDRAKREEKERCIKLIEAGWKKDRSGEWVKDENCEFDTDEDEPS